MSMLNHATESSLTEESSGTSFNLDEEEKTLFLDEQTTFEDMKDGIENTSYTEIEFSHCPPVPYDDFLKLIQSINQNLKSLIIYDTYWLNDECMEMLTAFCNKLRKLDLGGCLHQISCAGIGSIGRNCGSILSLSILAEENSDGAKEWILDSRVFPALINNMTPRLKHFAMSGIQNLTHDALEKFLSYFRKSLLSLDFSSLPLIDNAVLKSIGMLCERLFVLKLNNCTKITDEGIRLLLLQKCKLEVVELCGCTGLTDLSCELIAKNCPQLSILKLDGCKQIGELSLVYLSSSCRKLSYISLKNTEIKALPSCLSRLKYLNYLNLDDCNKLEFPSQDVINEGIHAIRKKLLEYDISHRIRCFILGGLQSGKTSLTSSLLSDQPSVAEGATVGIPVSTWHPFSSDINSVINKAQEDFSSLSVELWDCSGRKALDGIHSFFINMRIFFVVSFNLTIYSHLDKVVKWVSTIQAKAPGSYILIVGSHCDLTTEDKIQEFCHRIMLKVKEQEENQLREIREELLFLRDLGLFSIIGAKRRRLEWLLEKRPKIHPDIVVFSSVTGQGIKDIRNIILSALMDVNTFTTPYTMTKQYENVYHAICNLRNNGTLMVHWRELKDVIKNAGIAKDPERIKIVKLLSDLGCILFTDQIISQLVPNFNAPNLSSYCDITNINDNCLVCINPPVLANAMALLHRDEENPQDLLNKLTRAGHVDAIWSGKKPYDWTFRKVFTNVITNGMIRESIIPLLVTNTRLSANQFEVTIKAMQQFGVLVAGAPNAAYDVELVVPSLKNMSVYKRYFLPLQGMLPVIPQVNAWLPKCPSTHIQVGWDYRFISTVPMNFFLFLVSICTVVKEKSEILSYWKLGTYIRNGEVDICIAQWKDKLVLQVLARVKVTNGTRQAVNRAWCCLTSYFYTLEKIMCLFPGLYYEVLAVSNNECKPVLEVIDEFEAGDISETDVLWYIPLKGCTRSTIRSVSLPPDYLTWLKNVAGQNRVHIGHSNKIAVELKPIICFLESAGYDVTTDSESLESIKDARLVLVVLTSSYFTEGALDNVRSNTKDKKILVALFEEGLSLENQGYEEILLNKIKIDISGGSGTGQSYQPNAQQIKSLVEACHVTVFGHGSLGEAFKRKSSLPSKISQTSAVSFTKKPFEQFAEIINSYSSMSKEAEMKHVAATAVAAAVASATAEHIAKQSNPTMGAKAAAMAAEVADAVAKGDSERAANAVIATAKAVDEVVAFSKARASITSESNGAPPNAQAKPKQVQSTMCIMI